MRKARSMTMPMPNPAMTSVTQCAKRMMRVFSAVRVDFVSDTEIPAKRMRARGTACGGQRWPATKEFYMTSKSLWADIVVAPDAQQLDGDARCDVAVIGSGIAGLSTAYELAERGMSVMVIDRGKIASGMTSRTSAHLAPLCDDLMSEMKKIKGIEQSKLFYESHAAAVDRIEEIQKKHDIDCDFRRLDGFLFQGNGMPAGIIDQELDVVREVGAPVHRLMGVPLKGCEDRHALGYPRQATFHPLKYLAGLSEVLVNNGVRLVCDTPVEDVFEENGAVTVKTARGRVRAGQAVVATNSPISDRFALHSKMAPYRTYVIAFEIKSGTLPDGLYWDTEEPYHYVRLQPGSDGQDFVLVGGEDHKSGEADDADKRFERLEKWVRPLIPGLGKATHRWSGQVLDTIDYAGFIGRDPGSSYIYVATGDSGQGLTHGVVGAILNTSLILDGKSPWAEVYAPGRTPLRAAKNFLSENATALKNLADYVTPGEVDSVDALKPGHGGVVRQGLKKIAAYRDKNGNLHLRSAACTHLGCHLHWNSFETCWDCPCHGSMFDVDGQPINAPAISPLANVD
jgi:glycine/D-amino acid oxidase-like deaminating enzyme/nitrite reductase/ring-hydroxylating ferredoxin subunit